MNLLNIQKKYIESKPFKNTVIKGKANSNTIKVILHRILNLVNNFTFEEEDNILFVDKDVKEVSNAKDKYIKIEEENKYKYYSLLCSNVKPQFIKYSELIKNYMSNYNIISNKEKISIVVKLIEEGQYKKCKKINVQNIYLIINEIKYIKINKVSTLEEYMELAKIPMKLRKKSYSRNEMFRLFKAYNKELSTRKLLDEEDLINGAINNINSDKRYSHIFVNNAQDYSKLELEFLMKLAKNKSFSTLTLIINLDKGENIYSNLVNKGRVYLKRNFADNKKVYNFSNEYVNKNKIKSDEIIEDKYTYMDLKHKRDYEFYLDSYGTETIISYENDSFKNEEIENIPVFNNIAAGEPILINPIQEDTFDIPKYWIKSNNPKFILKVKGNSMINANINNDDLVVIEQNPSPLNGDIIAVNIDGNATLKKLKIDKNKIILMPENENYEPIIINENEEFFVLGKAIGIIKRS